ncbi:MAG: polysaccharide deacetylase family protein [Lachnospiraceae bacterium]|nr:polysaccharide deacetylase family protein [Lachnospiraceae bacterium]
MKKLAYLLCMSMTLASLSGCSAIERATGMGSKTEAALPDDNNSKELDFDTSDDEDEGNDVEYYDGTEDEIEKDVEIFDGNKDEDDDLVEEISPDSDDLDEDDKDSEDTDDLDSDDLDDDLDDDSDDEDDSVVFKDLDDGGEVESKIPIPMDTTNGLRLNYPQIELSGLDNTAIGWGMGPDRDEFNRPITALQYQQEYQDYHADFIVPEDDPAEDKKVYLTFDEGYENGFSNSILDTLKAHHANAIFFITKPYAVGNPELVQRMIDEGHIVGNHTVNHPSDGMQAHDLAYQTNEVIELNDYVRDTFGYQMCLFRYPTGMFSRQSLALVSNCGYRSVFWSFAYADWDRNNQPAPADALAKVEAALHPGAIYLLHAVSQTNATILNDFLTYIESQGYEYGNYYDYLDD